jgi:hypothetical protein
MRGLPTNPPQQPEDARGVLGLLGQKRADDCPAGLGNDDQFIRGDEVALADPEDFLLQPFGLAEIVKRLQKAKFNVAPVER